MAKFGTNASGILFSWRDNSSFRCYTLGPLCLWQCLLYAYIYTLTYFTAREAWYTWTGSPLPDKLVGEPDNGHPTRAIIIFYCENKNTLYNINFNHICLKGNHLILKALHVEENCEHENILYNLIFNHISLKGKHLSLK